jgi:hypothetical protein
MMMKSSLALVIALSIPIVAACGGKPSSDGSSGQAATSGGQVCMAPTDCTGLLPRNVIGCSDGTTAGAHWDCNSGQCDIAYCETKSSGAQTCKAPTDCKGALPRNIIGCSDGTTAGAHWDCTAGQCDIGYCESSGMGASDAGTGRGEGGASDGGGYAFVHPRETDRHHSIALESGASKTVSFQWNDASGTSAPADLWVEARGKVALQVSSVGERPFARAGLEVAPLEAGRSYRLVLQRGEDTLTVTLEGASGDVLLRTQVGPSDTGDVAGATTADVVLPSTFLRSTIESPDLL